MYETEQGGDAPEGPVNDRQLHPPDLAERGRRVRLEAKAFSNAVGSAIGELESVLRDQLGQRPYAVLGAALGVGYVLGGGLSGRLLLTLGGMGGRLAVAGLLRNALDAREHVAGEGE